MEVSNECGQGWKNGKEKIKLGLQKRGEMKRNTIKGTDSERLKGSKNFQYREHLKIRLADFKGTK